MSAIALACGICGTAPLLQVLRIQALKGILLA
jgi:hypothetical protein